MGKRLLTKDYDDIVFEAFKMPESDFFKYYSNIIDEKYQYNPDIFNELESAINRWIDWYKSQVLPILKGKPISETKALKMEPDIYEGKVPLIEWGIKGHVNKAFFDRQWRLIQVIKLKKQRFEFIERHGNIIPDYVKKELDSILEKLEYETNPDQACQLMEEHQKLLESKMPEIQANAWIQELDKWTGDVDSNSSETFETLLNDPENVLPVLKLLYKKAKPREYALMLFALHGMEKLKVNPIASNRTKLHEMLKEEFGNIGTLRSLTININKFSSPSQYEAKQIEAHTIKITNQLKD